MVDRPFPITTEIRLDGEWVDISEDVQTRKDLDIKRGRADESATAAPSKLNLRINNRHGRYSPRNPLSPYYGQLRRNVPIRVRLGDIPEPEDAVLVDDFNRTESSGWGDADTGQTWSVINGTSADFSVSDGAGRIDMDANDTWRIGVTDTALEGDLDIEAAFSVSGLVQGLLPGSVPVAVERAYGDVVLVFTLAYRVRTGTSLGTAPLSADITVRDAVDRSLIRGTDVEVLADLDYAPDAVIRMRAQIDGPQTRMRLWADGSDEPDVWHAQFYAADLGAGDGDIRVAAVPTASADLSTPLEIRCHEITARPYSSLPPVVRFTGEVAAWPPRWDVSDTDMWVPLQAAGIKRRLGQGRSAVQSLMREIYTKQRPAAYWPLEDGADTTLAASAVGGDPLRVSNMTFGEDDSLVVSEPLPVLTESSRMSTRTLPVADTGAWTVEINFFLSEDDSPSEDGQVEELLRFTTSGGTAATWVWDVEFTDAGGLLRRVQALAEDGTQLDEQFFGVSENIFLDQWVNIRIMALQNGGDVEWNVSYEAVFGDTVRVSSTSFFTGTVGTPAGISTRFGAGLKGMSLGHVAVWGGWNPTARFEINERSAGGEAAGQRVSRLASAREVPLLLEGEGATEMGVQPVAALLQLLDECERTDLGALTEQRSVSGLRYRTRDTLYNQTPSLVLDYESGEVSPPVEPTDDDQRTRNDVTAKRSRGSEARVVDEDGPMGVRQIGRYDESVTINVLSDHQLPDQAAFRLHLGTVDEARLPVLHLNLANPRMLIHHEDVLALDTGDRIRVLNPPIWVGADALDLIVQGYEEKLGLFQWDITVNCTPASPWEVWTVTDGTSPPGPRTRLDTSGSELALAAGEDDTELLVSTDSPYIVWISTDFRPQDFPMHLQLGGEVVQVTDITGEFSPQSMTVERSINGIVKEHPAGTRVRLARVEDEEGS